MATSRASRQGGGFRSTLSIQKQCNLPKRKWFYNKNLLLPVKWYAEGRTWVAEIGFMTLRQEAFFLSEVFCLHAGLASD